MRRLRIGIYYLAGVLLSLHLIAAGFGFAEPYTAPANNQCEASCSAHSQAASAKRFTGVFTYDEKDPSPPYITWLHTTASLSALCLAFIFAAWWFFDVQKKKLLTTQLRF